MCARGCKFVLLRNIGKGRVATLKRTPTVEEWSNFNTSIYPKTLEKLAVEPWSSYVKSAKTSGIATHRLEYAVDLAGAGSADILSELNNVFF